jgi:hypothetical protein
MLAGSRPSTIWQKTHVARGDSSAGTALIIRARRGALSRAGTQRAAKPHLLRWRGHPLAAHPGAPQGSNRAARDRLAVSLRREQAAGAVPDHAATLDDLREFQCLDPAIGRSRPALTMHKHTGLAAACSAVAGIGNGAGNS